MLTSQGLPSDSTCVLKAEPSKLDIKRCKLGILFISFPSVKVPSSKTCLKGPLKRKTKNWFFQTDYRLMQVKSIADCSKRAFCNTFDLHLAIISL